MTRYCFALHVRPEMLAEYERRHAAVWPDMLAALAATGWRNYSLFSRPDGLLIGYVEADDLQRSQAAVAQIAVNATWQAEMAPFFAGLDGARPDQSFEMFTEIFNLDSQLAAGLAAPASPPESVPATSSGSPAPSASTGPGQA